MGFNNTTVVFPSPSPFATPSPSPSLNVTLINITTNELPLAVRIDDPAFPSLMVQWVAILCFTAMLCVGSVPSMIGIIVQIVLNVVLRILNLGEHPLNCCSNYLDAYSPICHEILEIESLIVIKLHFKLELAE